MLLDPEINCQGRPAYAFGMTWWAYFVMLNILLRHAELVSASQSEDANPRP